MRRLLLFVLLTNVLSIAQTIVPSGKPILMDGKLSPREWKDAAHFDLERFGRVFVKQSPEYVYIAVQLLDNPSGTVDLYLALPGGRIYDLHASAKLGERTLQGKNWPEEWAWWNNDGWAANVSRVESFEKRTFLKETVREFQISKSRFPGSAWRLMFEIMTEAHPQWKVSRFPSKSSNTDPKDWYLIRLLP